jgi:hypothetical protein
VSVDSSSGRIVLNRIAVAHDCGLIFNTDELKQVVRIALS